MKVLLIQPPRYFSKFGEIGQKQLSMNTGIAYIASYIRHRGIDVSIYDASVGEFKTSDLQKVIMEKKPDIIGISASTIQIVDANYIADLSKSIDNNIVAVIGGAHASALPEGTLKEFKAFDYLVEGEGEETFYKLISYLSGNGELDDRGLYYRENGDIKSGKSRPLIEHLDDIPFPAYDLFLLDNYKPQYSHDRGVALPVFTTRGCSYDCSFCSGPMGRRVRFRTVKNIIEELKMDIERYHPSQILIGDDTFTIRKSFVIEVCEAIIKEGINKEVEFICETRTDVVDREILMYMKNAGVRSVTFGIESGDDEILKKNSKGITRKDSLNAVNLAREVGLEVDANFILGLSYEDKHTIKKTIDFACSLPLDYASFFTLVPYPGTEVAKMAEHNEGGLRLLSKDWSKYGKQTGGILELENISYKRLKLYQLYAYIRFYSTPKHFLNAMKRITPITILVFLWHIFKHQIFGGLKSHSAD